MPDLSSSLLIAVEGIDGAGKTTQVAMLREVLERAGQEPIVSKEPTNGQWGRLIKESASTGRLSLDEELNAFFNDRREHADTTILPALKGGRIVILDRYFYSSIAYQGSRGVDPQDIKLTMESKFPIPDAVFVLDVDPALGLHRIAHSRGENPNHFEQRGDLAKAREIFQSLSGPNIHHLDGAGSREDVHSKLVSAFINGALKTKRCAKQYGCDNLFDCSYRILGRCEWFKLAQALGTPEVLARL